MTWTFPAIVRFALAILEQFWNALLPILINEFGMFMVPIDEPFWNALAPIDNKLPPSATSGIREQFPNADTPIVIIFPAMVSVLDIFAQFSNALSPIELTLRGMFKITNELLFLNALAPIESKLPPSATAGIREQFPNAEIPIVWIFPEIVMVLNIFEQFSNALFPIELTLSGIFKVPNDVLFLNALMPIDNKFPPSTTAGIREQFPNAEIPIVWIFPAMVRVLDIFEQFSNALFPIELTLRGMFIVPNDVLFRNALAPIDNKLPPSATAGILAQPSNAEAPIVWIFPAIVSVLEMFKQLWNAEDPMVLTLGGIFKVPNDVLLKNASAPIDSKLPPSATAGILKQSLNALVAIVVIFPAIVSVLVMLLQLWNAEDPMVLTLGGIFKVPNDVLLKNACAPIDSKFPPSATAGILAQP
jgi:hypothetical protein